MSTKVKMSDSIILDAQNLAKNRTVYIRVTNTSEMQDPNPDLENQIWIYL